MFTITNITIYDIVMLLGAIQGIILSFILYFKSPVDNKPNRYLSLLLITFSLHLLHQLGFTTGFFNQFRFLHIIPYSYLYLIGPAIYFYVRTMVSPTSKVRAKNWIHFLPALYVIPALIFYYTVLVNGDKANKLLFFKAVNFIENYVVFLAVLIYLLVSVRVTLRVHQWQQGLNLSSNTIQTLRWIKHLTWVLFLVILSWKVYYFIHTVILNHHLNMNDYYPFYLVLAVLIYWLGFNGYTHQHAFYKDFKEVINLNFKTAPQGSGTNLGFPETHWDYNKQESAHDPKTWEAPNVHEQLAKVGLDLYQAKDVLDHISLLLETQQLYKNNHLSLQSFAQHVGYNSRVVSAVINSLLNKNFNDYINEYRVKEVLHRIKMRDYSHLTILGIAQESGFSSKSTFNRTFKEVTGKTPKDYKRYIDLK